MSTAGPTILIIEPDVVLARVYANCLKARGYGVSVAHHAMDAIANADETMPAAVVMDLGLGEHNGLEFLYEFRSYAEWRNIPVLLLTAVPPHNLLITAEQMQQLGIVTCLYKPATSLMKLRQVLADVVPLEASELAAQ